MLQPSRHGGESYRYGFGSHEKDDEIKGEGNHISFGDYGYDTRLGRRFNIDPMIANFPWMSPYAVFNNNPIYYTDNNGETPVPFHVYTKGILNEIPKLSPEEIQSWQNLYYEGLSEANEIYALAGYDAFIQHKKDLMYNVVDKAEQYNFNLAAGNLEHYLDGSGKPKVMNAIDIVKYQHTRVGMEYNMNRFFNFTASNYKYKNVADAGRQLKEGESVHYDDYYKTTIATTGKVRFFGNGSPTEDLPAQTTDLSYALGNFTLKSTANFDITRKNNKYFITGYIGNIFSDTYNWEGHGFDVDIFGVTISDIEMKELINAGAKEYKIESTEYKVSFQKGSFFTIDGSGNADFSNVKLIYD